MAAVHFLNHGSCCVLPARADAGGLQVIVGGGRGCVLEAEAALAGLWLPLRGRLQLGAGGGDAVTVGDVAVTDADAGLRAIGRGNALWLAVLGERHAWQRAIEDASGFPCADPPLLPARHGADIALRRRAVSVLRAAIAHAGVAAAVTSVVDAVCALQRGLDAAIERCPGRTHAQRRLVFMRLQRVRHYVIANCHRELDNDELARIANYSPWQFIRAFRSAYAQTPHAFVIEQRLRRAQRLLATSPLSIAEIAAASGFEDRCAFSRLFSERFGVTARAFRRDTTARLVA